MATGLRERINADLKEAMKTQDKRRVSTLRLVMAAIKDRDIQSRGTGKDDTPSEADLQAVLTRMIKQRKESAATYDEGGRPELAEAEREEVTIIEAYLPRQMDEAEIGVAIEAAIAATGAAGLKDMGRVMAALKESYAGQMDMARAGQITRDLLK
jgi:uncharacterized protein YqeY